MNDVIYIRKDDKWRLYCHQYLIKNGFCADCEKKGMLTVATIVYQPSPEKDKLKGKFSEYNLRPLCAECFYGKQISAVVKKSLIKAAFAVVAIGILLIIIQ